MVARGEGDAETDSDERDCHVNVADDVQSLSVISKSINTSYINLKRHNPLKSKNSPDKDGDLSNVCPELIRPTRY